MNVTDTTMQLVNCEKYPIHQTNTAAYQQLVSDTQQQLHENGSVSLKDFLTADTLKTIQQQVTNKEPEASRTTRVGNAYDAAIPEDAPEDHALRILERSTYSSLGRSQLSDTLIENLYTDECVRKFVSDVLELPQLYLHADPYNAVVVMMYGKDDNIAWHFDYGHFVCLINLHEITDGGFHECAADVRTPDNEGYQDVADVLRGNSNNIKQSRSTPGAFTIFKGKYSLHRVTTVTGDEVRKSLVMTYEENPGVMLNDEVRARYFANNAPRQ